MTVRTDRGEYTVDQVLGADGANSIVRKKLARPFASRANSRWRRASSSTARRLDIVIRTTREQPGYLWSFPRPDHLAVGICAPPPHRTPRPTCARNRPHGFSEHGLHRHAAQPYAWPIPSIGFTPTRHDASQRRGMDAARGRRRPGRSADARRHLLRAAFGSVGGRCARRERRARAAARYAERVLDDIQPELARAARLSRLFFTRRSRPSSCGAGGERGIRHVFVDLVAGVQPYRGLRRRLLATRQWGLAARAIRMLLSPAFTGTMNGSVALPPRNVQQGVRHGSDWFA